MRFTKLGHSCIKLEKDGAVLVIDPGIWSDAPAALAGAAAAPASRHDAAVVIICSSCADTSSWQIRPIARAPLSR